MDWRVIVVGLGAMIVGVGLAAATNREPPADDTPVSASPEPEPSPSSDEEPPPLALGEVGRVGDWELQVTAVDLDATQALLASSPENTPPDRGSNFVLASVAGVYTGDRAASPSIELAHAYWVVVVDTPEEEEVPLVDQLLATPTTDPSPLPSTTFVFNVAENRCGILPRPITGVGEVAPGEPFVYDVCFTAPEDLLDDGQILIQHVFDGELSARWDAGAIAG